MKSECKICPRNCGANRKTTPGYCKCSEKILISKVMFHHFEEPIISGASEQVGSGAIFFSGCNLKCVYCQNYEISSSLRGREVDSNGLAEIIKKLQDAGALNINLVTPTHFTQQIIEALKIFKPSVPVIWNTSGYEKPETIELLKDYVDIYLTDLKYFSPVLSKKFSNASDYFDYCSKSILKMRENQPQDVVVDGLLKKGLIIRHLVLPNQTQDSINVINWIHNHLGNQTILSLMSQYVPMFLAKNFDEINRKIKPIEYKILINYLNKFQFKNVFLQDFSSANCIFTPKFDFVWEI